MSRIKNVNYIKYGIYIICGGLLVLNFILGYNMYLNNKLSVQERNFLNKKINKYFSQNIILKEDAIISKQGVSKLSPYLYLYTESGDSITLLHLKKKKNTLVLRYSFLSCTSCIDYAIECLQTFERENDDVEVLLLSSYRFKKDIQYFEYTNHFFTNVYYAKSLKLAIEDEDIPYLFVLDEDMRVVDLFIPRKEIPELTQAYLEKIKKTL